MRFDERASARSAISRSKAPSMAVAMVGSSAGELAAAGAAGGEGDTCARRAVGVSGCEGWVVVGPTYLGWSLGGQSGTLYVTIR